MALFILMVMTFCDVVLRSVFNAPIEAATELTRILMAILVFSVLPMISAGKGQIAVDLTDGLFSRLRLSRARDAIVYLASGIMLIWPIQRVWILAERARDYGDVTEYLSIPVFYVGWFIAASTAVTAVAMIVTGDSLHLYPPFLVGALPMTAALIGFALVLVLVLLRLPIVFAMGLVGTLGFAYERGGSILSERGLKAAMSMVGRQITDTAQDYGLSVIPLFILMGLFVNKGGLARELYAVSNAFLGHFKGGIAMATVAACGGFSAICGSSLATAATMSKVAMPEMRRYRYSDELSTASIAAGGTLGILIPPSVILVIYGLLTETSIGKLFVAGILPGVLGILLYLFAVRWTVWRNPESGPAGEKHGWGEKLTALRSVWAVLLLFFLVIGGLYGAFDFHPLNLTFSPTEAAGMGAMGAFLIALSRGGLTLSSTFEVLKETTYTAAALFSVLIGAQIFSNFINLAGLPEALIGLVTAYDVEPFVVILMILGIYIILGCVFESLSMLLLTVPIFFPLVTSLGYDPIWFGIVVVVVTEISLITPPVGLNVFILKGVVGDVSTATIFKGVTPFWIADIFRLALIVLVPWLVLVLPEHMGAMGH